MGICTQFPPNFDALTEVLSELKHIGPAMALARTYNPIKQKTVISSVVSQFKCFFSQSSYGLLHDMTPIGTAPSKDRIADMLLRPVNMETYASIKDITGNVFLKAKVLNSGSNDIDKVLFQYLEFVVQTLFIAEECLSEVFQSDSELQKKLAHIISPAFDEHTGDGIDRPILLDALMDCLSLNPLVCLPICSCFEFWRSFCSQFRGTFPCSCAVFEQKSKSGLVMVSKV